MRSVFASLAMLIGCMSPSGGMSTDASTPEDVAIVPADTFDASAEAILDASSSTPPGWIDPSGGKPASTCERTLPIQGSPCVGSLTCTYPFGVGCSNDHAQCVAGAWTITLGLCDKCPPPVPRPEPGSACTVGKGCRFVNACGGVDVGICVGAQWRLTPGACHKACPPVRPVHGSPCAAISAETCSMAGSECGVTEVSCIAKCLRVCADGVVLEWASGEPFCGGSEWEFLDAGLSDAGGADSSDTSSPD